MGLARIVALLCGLITLSAVAVLVVGCGTSSTVASGAVSPTMKAQAIAYAHAVNLRVADVPGLVGSRPRTEIRSGPFGAVMEKCDGGAARAGEVIGVLSESFERNNKRHNGLLFRDSLLPIESVQSTVYLTRSSALASHEFAIADSARARACLKSLNVSENHATKREGATAEEPLFTDIEVAALTSPLHAVRVYGLRVTANSTLESSGTTGHSNYYEDFLGFVIGPAVITLHTKGDPRPFPSATEGRLLSLLYSRAEAYKL
jgi:hypothetical protein